MTKVKMTFDPEVARDLDTDSAIILSNIEFWQDTNEANGRNYYEGRYWTYNSAEAFSFLFTWLTPKQIRTRLKKLEDSGYVVSGRFGENTYDHTKWYSVNKPDAQTVCIDLPKWEDRSSQTVESIIGTDNKPNKKQYTYSEMTNQEIRDHVRGLSNTEKKKIWKHVYQAFIPEPEMFLRSAKELDIWDNAYMYSLKAKYDSWVENNWMDGNDKPIINYKTKIRNTLPFLKKVYK